MSSNPSATRLPDARAPESGSAGRGSRALRVLVDGMHLMRETKGVGLYTRNVLEHLVRLDPQLEIVVLVLAGEPRPLPGSAVEVRQIGWRNHLWHGFRTLPRLVRQLRPDVVWLPYETPTAALRVPMALVCHDIPSAIRSAQRSATGSSVRFLGGLLDRLGDRLLARTLRAARIVFANSRWVSERLISDFGVERPRLRLAPCAPGADFESLSRAVDVAAVRRRLAAEEGYVLTFFTGDARENPGAVAEVYHRLVERGIRLPLVVAGLKPDARRWAEELYRPYPWAPERVRWLPFYGPGELSELVGVYTAAAVYFDPSLQEGFGMQVIEAMACGTPVVCSDRGALPEVAGEAALLADPEDREATVRRLLEVVSAPQKSAELSALGIERARRFSWARTAETIYRGLLEAARVPERGARE